MPKGWPSCIAARRSSRRSSITRFAALVSTDAAGHIVEFNPAAAAMFGRSRDEVLGRPVSEVVIPERFRPAHDAGMRRLQAGGEGRVLGKRLAMHALRADGSEFPMEMVLWRTAAGGAVFYTASIADVSERHDAERQIERQREALRQSEKLTAMGSLLAGVAHELNNPLAIVMGRASLLEEKCEDQPELKADAARIREAAERCGRIVRTFLDMARNRPSRRSPVSLNEMARAAAEMLLYGYQTHDIELELSLADGLPAVQADADQIGQVVMNLLVNAQQALAGFDGARRVRVETGVQPATRRARRRSSGCGCRTTVRASTAACARACSSRSSPPRPRARAPASGWRSRARWRATTAATSSSSRGRSRPARASC